MIFAFIGTDVTILAAAGLMCRDNRQYSTYKADMPTTSTYPKNRCLDCWFNCKRDAEKAGGSFAGLRAAGDSNKSHFAHNT